jgi:hypothetical protein
MQEFVHRKNLENYRMLLAGELDKNAAWGAAALLAEERGEGTAATPRARATTESVFLTVSV